MRIPSRLPNRACFLVVMSGLGFLAGCGGTPASTSNTSGIYPANLTGDWKLAGALPDHTVTNSPPAFGLTATFLAVNNAISGTVTAQLVCTGGGLITTGPFATIVTGTVAADGSFSLQTPTTGPGSSLTAVISGHVPATAGGAWTGNYVLSSSVTGCSPASGAISASSFPSFSGTYKGNLVANALTGQTVSVSTTITEGGTYGSGSTAAYIPSLLAGTITLQGAGCLTSGTPPSSSGSVQGNTLVALFQMNDGSTLQMLASAVSSDGSQLDVEFTDLGNGTCNSSLLLLTGRLTRQ